MAAKHEDVPAGRLLLIQPTVASRDLLRCARELRIETVVACQDRGDRRLSSSLRPLTDRVLDVDTNDVSALMSAVLDLHKESPVTSVIPGFEFYVEVAALLAQKLGLPGLSIDSAAAVRNKTQMLTRARDAGLAVPAFRAVSSVAELDNAAAQIGFPLVIKPIDSAGSVHVYRADDMDQLRASYLSKVNDSRQEMGRRPDSTALVQEYVPGPEFSAEGYVEDGTVHFASVTEKILGPEPRFVEMGQIVPCGLPEPAQLDIQAYVERLVHALGITLGPFHCELRLPDGVPILMEIAARLPGSHIVDLVDIAVGISLPRVMLASYTGRPVEEICPPHPPRANYAGIAEISAPDISRVERIFGFDRLKSDPAVIDAKLFIEPPEEVPLLEDARSTLGHVIFTAATHEEAIDRFHQLPKVVTFDGPLRSN